MTKALAIVTGTSRGIGEALIQEFSKSGYEVVGISRNQPSQFPEKYHHVTQDLADPKALGGLLFKIFKGKDLRGFQSICLVNNAGTVNPLGPFESCSAEGLTKALQINLLAPQILCAQFIALTKGLAASRRILNITSGLAARAMFGLGAYCVAKAGLEALTRSLAEEQKTEENPVVVISVRPGTVDSAMQKQLRESPKDALPGADFFASLKSNEKLAAPAEVAELIVHKLAEGAVKMGSIYRVENSDVHFIA